MKTFFLYFRFLLYMLLTTLKMIWLGVLKALGKDKEAQEYLNKVVYKWAQVIVKIVGIKINKKGLDKIPNETCLYVANHQGLLDVPVIISTLNKPVGFVAKKEMLKFKLLSYWMKQIKCVFIDRQNVREAIKTINEGINNLKQGHSMLIFPEGTRSKGPNLGEFKKGSIKLAVKAKVPIVPIVIDGTYKAREGNKDSKITSADVEFIVLDPIYPKELSREEQSNLSETIKEKIQETLIQIRNK